MERLARQSFIAVFTVAALAVLAPSASAQDYPGTVPVAAPAPCSAAVTASDALVGGASAVVSSTCSQLTAGLAVGGELHSSPIDLPVVTVVGNTASFPVTLPADWDTAAYHTLTITNAASGRLLVNSEFYVDAAGKITAAPASGPLPRTGLSHAADLSKAAIVLLATGAAASVLARKRRRPLAITA